MVHHSAVMNGSRGLSRACALALTATLCACGPVFPPLAERHVGDSGFKYQIATEHGPGTRAASLRAELAANGFAIADGAVPGFRHSATNAGANLPCYSYVRVDWTEDRRGRVSLIEATRLNCR